MSPLVKTLLVNGLMAGTAARTAKKGTAMLAFYGLAGVIGFLAFVFFCIAGYSWLLQSYATPVAASITGGAILAIALSVAGTGCLKARKAKLVKKPLLDGGFLDNVESTMKSILGGFEEPVRDNPKLALLMAALAGFAAGDQIGDFRHNDETRH